MYKVGFILNGKSRRKKRFYRELQEARKNLRNIEFNVVETSQAGHATSLAFEFIHDGYTHLIAVGGDGTLHETINGVMRNYREDIVVGTLPYGSANDFVKTVKTPENLRDTFLSILESKHERIDIGKIEQRGKAVYFDNIADFGIGAEVVKKVNGSNKLFGASITFFWAIISTIFTYNNREITCKTDDWMVEGKVNSLVIANGKYFGNGMCIAPDAQYNDEQFQVVVIGDISTRDYLKNMKLVKSGKRLDHPKVQYKTASKLEVTSQEKYELEADGEFVGQAPATISIEPRKLNFLIV